MSRPRSTPAAKGKKAPAGRTSTGRPGVFVQAPKSDVYVALLGVALGAMIVGCVLLVMILKRYEFKTKAASLGAIPQAVVAISENPVTVRL